MFGRQFSKISNTIKRRYFAGKAKQEITTGKAKQEITSKAFKPSRKFDLHQCDGPTDTTSMLSREQATAMLNQMMTIRRMEMAADALYKQRLIRGFCHLAVGQEAVPVGEGRAVLAVR